MTQDEWKEKLKPEQYHVLREAGTERAFKGKYWNQHEDGTYTCAGCGAILFESQSKFDSGSGWPSFDKAVSKGAVTLHEDKLLGVIRTEVKCAKCGGHLGHLFDDGPSKTTGQRFCVNSAALDFRAGDTAAGL